MKNLLILTALYLTALLFIGSNANAQCDKDVTIYGPGTAVAGRQSFGEIVGPAGDVDGDGHADFLVCSTERYFSYTNAVASVYSGFTGELIRTYYDGYAVYNASGFGDYNSDGYDDLLINGVVCSGLTGDTLKVLVHGYSAGDVDGDGTHDILRVSYGKVLLFSGATEDTLQYWTGSITDKFGASGAIAGDVNNDGYPDVIIGAPERDAGETDNGRVYVYSGLDGSQLYRLDGMAAHTQFGSQVSGAGDLNNDGYDDFLVASLAYIYNYSDATVWAYSGQTGELLFSVSEGTSGDKFGYAIDAVGDISNDGYDDFIVGAPWYGSSRGIIYLFSGKDGTILHANKLNEDREYLGISLAGVGDTDGDGSPDYVAGCPSGHDPENPDESNYFKGAAYLIRCTYPSGDCQVGDDFDGDLWDNECDNCLWFENPYNLDDDEDGIGNLCENSSWLSASQTNRVGFGGINWAWTGSAVDLYFDSVVTEGNVNFSLTPLDGTDLLTAIPTMNPMKYTFTTDAVFEGKITISLPYLDTTMTTEMEEELKLYQKVNGDWVNISTTNYGSSDAYNSTLYNTIVGEAYSLGEFAIGGCSPTPDTDSDGIGDLCDNCRYAANPGQEDIDSNNVGDACEVSQPLTTGTDVIADLEVAGETVSISFDTLNQAGDVDLSVSSNGPDAGSSFAVFPAEAPIYYNITTDAVYSGTIKISLSYDDTGLTATEEGKLALWHHDGVRWVDITIERDAINNVIYGETTSLSPFALGLAVASECCGRYSTGYTGNTDCDIDGKHNLSDITTLIDRIFLSKTPLCCEENGNVDGDVEAKMNLSDITSLIDHIFLTKGPSAPCL